ncbi:PREDICTED: speriolin [Chaetura pelagica]|uniref:speriolin n=1 Tax=Chaetura pelagica TaxID=8897 RepID=UPI000523D2F5|nr:PREDICTED: speriolin [Chaetura pelagica]
MEIPSTNKAAAVIASYQHLLGHIQGLLAENEGLRREVVQVRAQLNTRNVPRYQMHGMPSSAPPNLRDTHAPTIRFAFPSPDIPSLNWDLPVEQSSVFQNLPWDKDSYGNLVPKTTDSRISTSTGTSSGTFLNVPKLASLPLMTHSTSNTENRHLFERFNATAPPALQLPSVSSYPDSSTPQILEAPDTGSSEGPPPPPQEASQPTWEHLLGEMAFQLDRRILTRIFPHLSRHYGITVSNIPQKIMETALMGVPGGLEEQQSLGAVQRYLELIRRLRALGYSPAVHSAWAAYLVNTYGLMPPGMRVDSSVVPARLRSLLNDPNTMAPELQRDCLVLLTCLQEMAREDGQPLFIW